MSEPDRSSEGLVFVSTGRRLAAAKVGRRWHEVRGPLMIAAALASIQALLLFVVLRMLQDSGISLRWFVPIVALTTLTLVAWMGLVRAAFGRVVPLGQAPAAAILETIEAVRGPLRGGFDAASAQVLAYETRERLGYAAVSVCDRETVLAHSGLGADHHGAGMPAPPGAIDAMIERRVSRLPVGWKHGCDGRDCPLRSAIVAPIVNRSDAIGAIVLFSETALAVSDRDRAIARQLGALISTEVMLGELDLHARATASAELAAMQAQIEPHFLFNALNTIAAFCRTQPEEARRLVLAFAEHCRLSLRRPHAFVPLRDELRHVEAYVALERARFGDQLEVDVRVTPAAELALVPPLLVQPLVENAIKHGKADRPLRVVVRCDVRLGRLRITVRDNGRGIPRELADRVLEPGVGSGAAGLGLASAAQRVAVFYGEHGRLRIASAPRIGTLVSIVIPTIPPGHEQERLEDVDVVGEAASVREALALAARLDYDVVFCDISMPELTGIDAAREIMSWPKRPYVVFVTAHQDYAVQAFSVDAFDYLLKPVAEDRLAQTVERLRSALRGAPERAARGELAKVAVTRRGETLLLDHDQVYFMLAEGDYARIATYDERYLSTQSLRELEDALPPALFFRIHRSSIVNLQKVTSLEQNSPGHWIVRLSDAEGTQLEVARR